MRILVVLAIAACAGSPPPATRYYQLAAPPAAAKTTAAPGVLVIEALQTDGAYDDERMVYRSSPYRLDYYEYHRWTAPPGTLLAGYLAQALRANGRFRVVTTDVDDPTRITLGGRVIALEEVDASRASWQGHLALELVARDAGGHVVWTEHFDLSEPMSVQSPEGLARAVTAAIARVAANITPPIGAICDRASHDRGRREAAR